MKRKFLACLLCLIFGGSISLQAQYQIRNSDFESWDSESISLPEGWHSYSTASCNIQGLPATYAKTLAKVINGTSVHSKMSGTYPGGKGQYYITVQTRNVNASGISMAVSGIVSTGLFNIGSVSVYTPLNYFSTERKKNGYAQPLQATPDSLYLWVKYYGAHKDSSRARIVAYVHGDTDFQYMNHIHEPKLYAGYINYLLPRTDTAAPATHWTQLRLPFVYDGKAAPRYLLMYFASDSCIIGGVIGNELSVDGLQLVYSSWLDSLSVDGKVLPDFRKGRLSYRVEYPYGTPSDFQPKVRAVKEVDDSRDSIAFIPSAKGLDGAKTLVRVIGEDGSEHTYTIEYAIRTPSANAMLDTLYYELNGASFAIAGFHAGRQQYTVELPEKTPYIPQLKAGAQDTKASLRFRQVSTLPDTARVWVLAENGIDSLCYSVCFSVKKSRDTRLAYIKVNGRPLQEYADTIYDYQLLLDTGVVPLVEVLPVDMDAQAAVRLPKSIPGTVQIDVTAEDTSVHASYRLHLSIRLSDNADLMALGYRLGQTYFPIRNFHKDTLHYRVLLPPFTETAPQLSWTKADFDARDSVRQPQHPRDSGFVLVTAESDTIFKKYTVCFDVEISRNADLDSLFFGDEYFDGFDKDRLFYTVVRHYDSLTPPVIRAVAATPAAQLSIRQAVHYGDTARITVRAQDTSVVKEYGICLQRQLSPVAVFSSFHYLLGDADSIVKLQERVYDYTIVLKEKTTEVPANFTYVLKDARASVKYLRVPLSYNDTLQVRVLAEDMKTMNLYTFAFCRAVSADATLDSLWVNGEALRNFRPDRLQLACALPAKTQQIPVVTARAGWEGARVFINQASTVFGTAQVQVVAEDGVHQQTYVVEFHAANQDARLKAVYLDGGYPVPHFHPDTLNYMVAYGPDFPKEIKVTPVHEATTFTWTSEVNGSVMNIHILAVAEDTQYHQPYYIRIELPDAVEECAEDGIAVYPNPVSEALFLQLPENRLHSELDVYGSDGRLLLRRALDRTENVLSVEEWPQGVYFYRLVQDGRVLKHGKFVRQ